MIKVLRFRCSFSFILIRVLFCFFCFSGPVLWNPAVAQSTGFQIIENGESLQAFESALEKANLESYRLKKTDRVLGFKNGPQFILTSAEKMISAGSNIQVANYTSQKSLNKSVTLVFVLQPNSNIAVLSEIASHSKLAKVGKGFPAHQNQTISQAEFDQMSEDKQQIIRSRPHQYRVQ